MNTPKTVTDTEEARDLAEHIVAFYEREVMMGQYGGQWHRDAAGAKAILERDREAITNRVTYLLAEAAPLHNAVRAGKPPCEPKVRILGVDPAAVELQGMPLTDKTARARIVRLQDFGTGTPEGSDAWTFEYIDNRDSIIFFWIYQEIEQTVRLWAGSFEFDSKRGLLEDDWVLLGMQRIAHAHAERIEAALRERCPDPWLHNVAAAVGRMFRRCDIVDDVMETGRYIPKRLLTHVICTQALYSQFEDAPWRADVAAELAGIAITPHAWFFCTKGDAPALDADAVLDRLRTRLPKWTHELDPARLAHCARTLPAGSLVAGGSHDDDGDNYPGQRFDYTGHLRLRPAYCDARTLIKRTVDRPIGALPASPQEWKALEEEDY